MDILSVLCEILRCQGGLLLEVMWIMVVENHNSKCDHSIFQDIASNMNCSIRCSVADGLLK